MIHIHWLAALVLAFIIFWVGVAVGAGCVDEYYKKLINKWMAKSETPCR